jgi:D-hydroxyproline dehydrogenase subunit beta
LKAGSDIIIVGGGIIGATCAAECAQAGLKVLLLEREAIGGGTTGAGMGHLVVMDDSEAQFALTRYSRDSWNERAADLPGAVEYDRCGTLWVAADEQELAEARRKLSFYHERGVRAELLGAEALAAAEPELRRDLVGGLLVPDDGVLYPPCAATFFLDQARRHDARVRVGTEVRALLADGGVMLADGSQLWADVVVNAAGPWSAVLQPELPVRKRKGHLAITERYPGYVRHQIVELGYLKSAHTIGSDSVAFNVQPRKTGQILVGSSRQYGAEGTEINRPILERMLQRACEYLPGLGGLTVTRCWAGHRPATPDKLPLIGPMPDNPRLWLATGHEGLGITTCVGTARLLADMLLQRPTAIPAKPYLPARLLQPAVKDPEPCLTT